MPTSFASSRFTLTLPSKVIELDIAPFREKVKPVLDQFKPTLGPVVFEHIAAARK